MPAVLVLDRCDAFALERASENHRRPSARRARGCKGVKQRLNVVPVDDDGVPAEAGPTPLELRHVVIELGRLTLPQAVDIDNGAEIVEVVVRREVRRFPDRAFRHLAVSEQRVRPVVGPNPARVQRRSDRGADSLAERARGDVGERQARRRVPFEVRVDAPELQQLLAREQSGLSPRGVQDRRSMPLREYEPIRARVAADSLARTASRQKTAPRRSRRRRGTSSDDRCRPRSSSGRSRSGVGWRCCGAWRWMWSACEIQNRKKRRSCASQSEAYHLIRASRTART